MSESAELRAKLPHPVIDADAHLLEFEPFYYPYIRAEAGEAGVTAYKSIARMMSEWYVADDKRRQHERLQRPAFALPSKNTLDLATTLMPRLLYKRLDELGIDFMVVNPTFTLTCMKLPDPELRAALSRAVNKCHADMMRELSDRMTIAALIPTVTPQEAIAELEHAVGLGFKTVCIDQAIRRPIPAFAEAFPNAPASVARHARWIDTYALESPYDYDPFWKRCVELKVNITSHLPGYWGARQSTTNYVYNHLGQFADSSEALLKSLVLGGVTHRFPDIKFGLLEGGVGWACRLYCDFVEHFEKRNPEAMDNFHPDHIDDAGLRKLFLEYGGPNMPEMMKATLEETCPILWAGAGWSVKDRDKLDEWKKSGITKKDDLRHQFTTNFYFGCEADDKTVSWAFDQKLLPMKAKLRPMFGSDVGHWDVLDMREVLHEAHGLVRKGLLDDSQFREFTFENVARFYSSTNPDFFKGTVVASAVESIAK